MATQVSSLFATIGADLGPLNKGLATADSKVKGFGSKFTDMGKSLMKTGGMMTAGITVPIVAMGSKMFQSAAQFETGMNVMALAASSSGTAMEDLRAATIKVGGDTQLVGINAAEAAEAMTNFYKAGLQTNQIMGDMEGYMSGTAELGGALRAAIDMAAASEFDLASASDMVSIAMATFGIEAEDATKITDNFVRAADASVASVPELADAMVNVGSTFAAFYQESRGGIGAMEDVNTALAVLSQRGIKGSEAGTALKSMMTNMMRTSPKVTGALEELNIELYDQAGVLKPLPAIMAAFEKSLSGVTQEQRNQYVQTIVGTYGMKAMNTLLADGAEGWDAMTGSIAAAADTQAAAGARTKGLGAAWENLQGTIETLILQGTSPFMESVAGIVRGAADLIGKLVELDPIWFKIAGGIAVALAAAGPLVTMFGALASIVGFIASPIGLVVAAIVALGAMFVKANGGIGPAIKKLKEIGMAIGSLFKMLIGQGDYGDLLNISEILQDLGIASDKAESILRFFQNLGGTIGKAIERVKAAFKEGGLGGALQAAFGELGNIKVALGPLSELIKAKLLGVWDNIQEQVPIWKEKLRTALGAAIGTAWDKLKEKAPIWSAKLKAAIGTAWEKIQEQVPIWKEKLQGALDKATEAWDALKEKAPEWGEKLKAAIGTAWAAIQEKAPEWKEKLQAALDTASEAWDALKEKAPEWGEKLKAAIAPVWDKLQEQAPLWGEKLGAAVNSGVGWFSANLGPQSHKLGASLQLLWQKGAAKFSENGTAMGTSYGIILGKVVRGAITALAGMIVAIGTALYNVIKGMWSVATDDGGRADFEKGLLDFIVGVLDGFIIGITGNDKWATDLTAWFKTMADDAVTGIEEKVDDLITAGGAMVQGLIDGVKAKAQELADSVLGTVENAWQAAKGFLGISSPSKLFAEIGINTMRGLAEGLKNGEPEVLNSVADLVSNIADAFSSMGDAIGGMGGDDVFAEGGFEDAVTLMFTRMEYVTVKAMDWLKRITGDWKKALEEAAPLAALIKKVLSLLGVDLSMELPDGFKDASWMGQVIGYFKGLEFVGSRVMDWLSKITPEWAAMLVLAAPIATDIKKVMNLLGVDLSMTLPDGFKDASWMGQVTGYFAGLKWIGARAMDWLQKIGPEWAAMLAVAAPIATNIAKLFALLGVDLAAAVAGGAVENFEGLADTYFENLQYAFEAIYAWLKRLAQNEDLDMIELASTIAGQLGAVFGLLNVNLADIKAPKANFATTLTAWADGLELVADTLMPVLESIQTKWGSVLDTAQATAQAIGAIIGAISDAVLQSEAALDAGGFDIGGIRALLSQFGAVGDVIGEKLSTATGDEGAKTYGNEGAKTYGNEGAKTYGNEGAGVIRVHLMLGENLLQEVTLRVADIIGAGQDLYLDAGLQGDGA